VTLDLGVRAETYSDFGQSLMGKVAGRAQLLRWLSLRGAVSNGFRAPSLHQLWFSNVQTLYLPGSGLRPSQVLTSHNQSPVTQAFGIPRLDEETSVNLSGGVAIRPRDNLSITADAYFIRIKDRIVLTSQFDNTNPIVNEILLQFPGVSQAQFFANAVDTHTTGVDVVADYATELGRGVFGLTAAANVTATRVKRVKIPPTLANTFRDDPGQLRAFFFDRPAENRLEDTLPHQRATASVRYTLDPVSALLRANYYGPAYQKRDDSADDERFGAKVLFDVNVSIQAAKHIAFAVGADNVLNTFPDKLTKDVNQSFGRNVYSRNQFGQNGGFYYLKLSLTLF
jgi:iron complex outermembrane receptor protein